MTTKQLKLVTIKPKMAGAVTANQLRALTNKQVKNLPKAFIDALNTEMNTALSEKPAVEPAVAPPASTA